MSPLPQGCGGCAFLARNEADALGSDQRGPWCVNAATRRLSEADASEGCFGYRAYPLETLAMVADGESQE